MWGWPQLKNPTTPGWCLCGRLRRCIEHWWNHPCAGRYFIGCLLRWHLSGSTTLDFLAGGSCISSFSVLSFLSCSSFMIYCASFSCFSFSALSFLSCSSFMYAPQSLIQYWSNHMYPPYSFGQTTSTHLNLLHIAGQPDIPLPEFSGTWKIGRNLVVVDLFLYSK